MSRPSHLFLITVVYFFGAIIAHAGGFTLERVSWLHGWLALIPISTSIHYANEYADYLTDALTVRTPFSGGSGALSKTGLSRNLALYAAWISLLIGSGLGIYALFNGSLPLVSLGLLAVGALFGWMYSLNPLALAWRGWGELDNAALGGIVLPLYGYSVQTGHVDVISLVAVLPFGAIVFINLLATTWPDRKADGAVGKFTLATRWSPQHLRLLYWAVATSTFILIPMLDEYLPPVVVSSCFIIIPIVIWGALAYTRKRSPLPTVAAMVLMLFVHLIAWWSTVDFTL